MARVLPTLRDRDGPTRSGPVSSLVELCEDKDDVTAGVLGELVPYFGEAQETIRNAGIAVPVGISQASADLVQLLAEWLVERLGHPATAVGAA